MLKLLHIIPRDMWNGINTSPVMWTLSLSLARWLYEGITRHSPGIVLTALVGTSACSALYLYLSKTAFTLTTLYRALPILLLPSLSVSLYLLFQ